MIFQGGGGGGPVPALDPRMKNCPLAVVKFNRQLGLRLTYRVKSRVKSGSLFATSVNG